MKSNRVSYTQKVLKLQEFEEEERRKLISFRILSTSNYSFCDESIGRKISWEVLRDFTDETDENCKTMFNVSNDDFSLMSVSSMFQVQEHSLLFYFIPCLETN